MNSCFSLKLNLLSQGCFRNLCLTRVNRTITFFCMCFECGQYIIKTGHLLQSNVLRQ